MNSTLNKFRKVTYPGVLENCYMVNEYGIVINVITMTVLAHHFDKDGYARVSLRSTTGNKKYGVHRIVAYQYHLNRDIALVVDHIDGNKINNHYSNLRWVTSGENTRFAIEMGLRDNNGTKNGNNKYSEELIREICKMLEDKFLPKEIFSHYNHDPDLPNVPMQLIYRLRRREMWHHVTKDYTYNEKDPIPQTRTRNPNSNDRFTLEEIHKICKSIQDGNNIVATLKLMNIDTDNVDYKKYYSAVSDIRRGRTWKHIISEYKFPEVQHRPRIIIDDHFFDMVDKGLDIQDIFTAYGVTPGKNPKTCNKLFKAYANRIEINSMNSYNSITMNNLSSGS